MRFDSALKNVFPELEWANTTSDSDNEQWWTPTKANLENKTKDVSNFFNRVHESVVHTAIRFLSSAKKLHLSDINSGLKNQYGIDIHEGILKSILDNSVHLGVTREGSYYFLVNRKD